MSLSSEYAMPPASEWGAGWRAVLASSIGYGTGLGMLSLAGGLFLRPMQQDFGWSAKALAIIPVIGAMNVVMLPLVGKILTRWGSRRVGIVGIFLLALALFVMAAVPTRPLPFYSALILIGLIAPLSTTPTFARCIATWFKRDSGAAFGITMNGVSFVALLTVPLTSAAIADHGWRAGFVMLGCTALFLGLPIVLLWFKERPVPVAIDESGMFGATLQEGFRDRRFYLLAVGLFLGGIPLGGFLGHLQAMLADAGVGHLVATSLGVVLAISVTLGRVGGGFLLDRLWDGGVACGLLWASSGGAVALMTLGAGSPPWLIVLAVLLVGLGQGAEADFVAYFSLQIFGTRSYSPIVSLQAAIAGTGFAGGAFLFAAVRDASGGYRMACAIGAACFAVAGLTLLVMRMGLNGMRPAEAVAFRNVAHCPKNRSA